MQNGLNEVHLRRLPKPPEVVLTAPAPGATYIYPEAVTLTANASDLDGSIVRVEFHSGPNVLFSKAAAPFSGTHNNLLPGTHALTATAFDDGGLSTRSAPVTITVLPPIPASPTALHAVETEYAAVSLGWSDQGTNEGGFRVYRSPAGSTLAIAGEVDQM